MLEHFKHGGHDPEVVISHHLRHIFYQDRVKIYFIGSVQNKSDGMYANDVRQLVTNHGDL